MIQPPPVPQDLVDRFGAGAVLKETPREFGFKALPPSGLIGPVQIIAAREIQAKY